MLQVEVLHLTHVPLLNDNPGKEMGPHGERENFLNLIIVEKTNWLATSTNFKGSQQSCFVLCFKTKHNRVYYFVLRLSSTVSTC